MTQIIFFKKVQKNEESVLTIFVIVDYRGTSKESSQHDYRDGKDWDYAKALKSKTIL